MSDQDANLKRAQRRYNEARDELDEIVGEEMLSTYMRVTGVPASDQLREAILEALRING